MIKIQRFFKSMGLNPQVHTYVPSRVYLVGDVIFFHDEWWEITGLDDCPTYPGDYVILDGRLMRSLGPHQSNHDQDLSEEEIREILDSQRYPEEWWEEYLKEEPTGVYEVGMEWGMVSEPDQVTQ